MFQPCQQSFHTQVSKVLSLFDLTIQAPEVSHFFYFFVSYILLPVICLGGTKTVSPEMSVTIFYICEGECWTHLQENNVSVYLLPVSSIFCHHFPQCLQHLDAQALLILLQQLLRVFDQSGQGHKT